MLNLQALKGWRFAIYESVEDELGVIVTFSPDGENFPDSFSDEQWEEIHDLFGSVLHNAHWAEVVENAFAIPREMIERVGAAFVRNGLAVCDISDFGDPLYPVKECANPPRQYQLGDTLIFLLYGLAARGRGGLQPSLIDLLAETRKAAKHLGLDFEGAVDATRD
jgi:hypothetical protein